MSNINSFAENVNKIVKNSNNQLALLNGIQKAMSTYNDSVSVSVTNTSSDDVSTYSIPSWYALNKKLDALSESINSLLEGQGIVKIGDGTGRTVELSNIATVPEKITGLTTPTTFSIDANWWFEDLMYPAAKVTVDLLGKVDDSADRVYVNRVILDYTDDDANNFYYTSGVYGSTVSYEDLISLLNSNGITYTEDKELLNLPLSNVSYQGNFTVSDIQFESGEQWYVLDTLLYKVVEDEIENQFVSETKKIQVGDYLSYKNYLYKIKTLDETNNRIQLECSIGYYFPQAGVTLKIYNTPWQTKNIDVKFSNNEIDIVYFKGVNENFNIIANEWSEPIMFVTNDLIYDGDNSTSFNSYYLSNIADWGKQFIDEIKERKISAVEGITPNAPSLNDADFSVVQINTQVNASLDTDEILKLKADIETTKSRISSLKSTIEYQQTLKQTITDETEFNKISSQINQNISDYKQLQISYSTSLQSMYSILTENNAIDVSPKYHIRGFFGIPNSVYNGNKEQQVIGFEIQYRYIKEDSTGVDLKTYTYTDANGAEHTGVYSDWNIMTTTTLEKIYSTEDQRFEWVSGNISDGTEININQVDIPITKGEKVEFRIRSISEAGYPYCPLKSDWSNSVVIEFPSNLITASDVENLINDINDENVLTTIGSELQNQGLLLHIDDSQANVNSVNNTYFKHQAANISYEFKDPDTNEIKTISVQEALDSIFAFIKSFVDYTDGNTNSIYNSFEITKTDNSSNTSTEEESSSSSSSSNSETTNSSTDGNISDEDIIAYLKKHYNLIRLEDVSTYINASTLDASIQDASVKKISSVDVTYGVENIQETPNIIYGSSKIDFLNKNKKQKVNWLNELTNSIDFDDIDATNLTIMFERPENVKETENWWWYILIPENYLEVSSLKTDSGRINSNEFIEDGWMLTDRIEVDGDYYKVYRYPSYLTLEGVKDMEITFYF